MMQCITRFMFRNCKVRDQVLASAPVWNENHSLLRSTLLSAGEPLE